MTVVRRGPCTPWIDAADVSVCCPDVIDAAALALAATYGSDAAFALSGHRFPGLCEDVMRPCRGSNSGCGGLGWDGGSLFYPWLGGFPSLPYRQNGQWFNYGSCCGDCALPKVKLGGPVVSVDQVLLDGVIMAPTQYALSGDWLVRIDGLKWPCTQDFTKDTTEVGTWEVEWTRGVEPTDYDKKMAAMLACEFARAICNQSTCLPANISSLARDGVSISFEDVETLFTQGHTGIPLVDQWLYIVNPYGRVRRATVARADFPYTRNKRLQ